MPYRGVRHSSAEVAARIAAGESVSASKYYLRTAPFFETAAPNYAWLNNIVAIGVGERTPSGATYKVFEILEHKMECVETARESTRRIEQKCVTNFFALC